MAIKKKAFLKQEVANPHVMILGPNEIVLEDLMGPYRDKVDLIYIDPPYNRGDDFKYYKDILWKKPFGN